LLYNRRVDWVVAISRRIRDVLIAAGVDGERISVIPSGVDVARFRGTEDVRVRVRRDEWGARSGEPVVLVVGALVARKGHAVLLRAARSLAARGLRPTCVFCGEGRGRSELEGLAADLGVAGSVRFMGWRSDVAPLLAAADIVVVPSLHEGLGVAALEAGAASRPVIASRTGGLAEVVLDGETGWLVPPDDPDALAAALEAALRDPEEARRRGAAAHARIVQEFQMERMGAATAALYRRLVHHVA
jgi:glycosyltransferase involved in cell wall biosynthesis